MSRTITTGVRGRLILRFPFDRNMVDLVKTLPGRRWHATERYWSVPQDAVLLTLETLEPEGFAFDTDVLDLYQALGGMRPFAASAPPEARQSGLFDDPDEAGATAGPNDWTVSGLNERVREVLQGAFPAPVWIVGELSGFNKSSHKKHVGFHLVERRDDGSTVSELSATLFERTRAAVERKLAEAGDPFRLEDEIQVRMLARVELYVPWGSYRVIVEDLDVAFTLGEAARRREAILRTLADEGLLEQNARLTLVEAPLRVGLITSLGSDAYNDVRRTLEESGYAFRLTAHGARVQGRDTEPSVLNALDWFAARIENYDAVLICRGGGSRIDLGWFDNEALGRAVAAFPLPIVVGIGHEQDHSVLDALARRAKTPTAAAQSLVERVEASWVRRLELREAVLAQAGVLLTRCTAEQTTRERRLVRAAGVMLREARQTGRHRVERLARAARATLDRARVRLSAVEQGIPRSARRRVREERRAWWLRGDRLGRSARSRLADAGSRLTRLSARIPPAARRRAAIEHERWLGRARRLAALDPIRVLERGYAILRTEDGVRIDRPESAPEGVRVTARLHGGYLGLRSLGPSEPEEE